MGLAHEYSRELLPTTYPCLGVASRLYCRFRFKKNVRNESEVLSAVGLIGILLAVGLYDKNTPYPSIYTLVPVIGAVLVILYSSNETKVGQMLAGKIFVGIGLVSYSAYLWHLPLKLYLDYILGSTSIGIFMYFVLLAGFSYSSYRFVEVPFRRKLMPSVAMPVIFVASIMLSAFGIIGHFNGGYPERSDLFRNLAINNGFGLSCNGNAKVVDECSNKADPYLAVLGNSYAMTWVFKYY